MPPASNDRNRQQFIALLAETYKRVEELNELIGLAHTPTERDRFSLELRQQQAEIKRLEAELANLGNAPDPTELERRLKELEEENERYRRRERLDEEQRREEARRQAEEAAAQKAMQEATTQEQRFEAYRKALQADPRVAYLQVLGMSRPLTVSNVYVKLRLHTRPGLTYDLDPALSEAKERNPNEHFKALLLYRETRSNAALDPAPAIRQYPRAVVMGDPGAGKTTLLKFLAMQAVTGKLEDLPNLPLHVELNRFAAKGETDLLAWVCQEWQERYGFPQAEARPYLEALLEKGAALVLLDALDETVTGGTREEAEQSYNRVVEAIDRFATRYRLAPVVVTVRKAGYLQRARLGGFTELEVLDFSPEDIRDFVEKWFGDNPDRVADLTRRLERNPRIQALAANPLLLTLIAIVHEEQLDLPDRRAELYKQCVDVLLTRWDTSRRLKRKREFKPDDKLKLLTEIAWHFHRKGERYLPETELLEVIENFLPVIGLEAVQSEAILDEIAAENGLLKEQAHGWHGYLHLTLQEYFAALYAAENNKLEVLLKHRDDPWWEEVILLYAGKVNDASPLLARLIGIEGNLPLREDIFYSNLLLAGRCLAARPILRRPNLKSTIIELIFQLLTETDEYFLYNQAALVLAEIGGSDVINRLMELLKDEAFNSNLGGAIVEALETLGERSIALRLVELLRNEAIPSDVQWRIVTALGILGERSIIPHLVEFLEDEAFDNDVRINIATTLGILGDQRIAPRLLVLLKGSVIDNSVKWQITRVLGNLGEQSIAARLIELLKDKSIYWDVKIGIAEALGALGERGIVSELVGLLKDESMGWGVQWAIAEALGVLGERSIAPRLIEFLEDEALDSSIRCSIAVAAGDLGEPSVIPKLIELLEDDILDRDIQCSIAAALGNLGERSIIPRLVKLLQDETIHWHVRVKVADALGTLGERSIAPRLVELLHDKSIDTHVREWIADTLGTLGEHSIAPRLIKLLQDETINNDVQRRVSNAVVKLVETEPELKQLVKLLPQYYIFEDLFEISRRVGARLYWLDEEKQLVEVVMVDHTEEVE